MKALLLSLIVITTITSCGWLDTQNPLPPKYDVELKNDETGSKFYGPAKDDKDRCALLKTALKEAKAADTVLLGAGTFDCDGKNAGTVFFPDGIAVVGQGADKTKLWSNVWSDDQGSAFEIRNGTYSDLTFENQTWQVNEDGRTIEFYAGWKRTADNQHYALDATGNKIAEVVNPGPYSATFKSVKFVGNAWTVYDWSGRGHTWNISDSVVVSGRQGISMMSGGGYFQNLNAERVTFDIDTMRSQDIGWTSNQQVGGGYGMVVRGGKATCRDCTFNIKCDGTPHPASFAPRCVGAFDGHGFGSASSPWTYIDLINPKFNVHGTASKDLRGLAPVKTI
jgi:hypothetical protein